LALRAFFISRKIKYKEYRHFVLFLLQKINSRTSSELLFGITCGDPVGGGRLNKIKQALRAFFIAKNKLSNKFGIIDWVYLR